MNIMSAQKQFLVPKQRPIVNNMFASPVTNALLTQIASQATIVAGAPVTIPNSQKETLVLRKFSHMVPMVNMLVQCKYIG